MRTLAFTKTAVLAALAALAITVTVTAAAPDSADAGVLAHCTMDKKKDNHVVVATCWYGGTTRLRVVCNGQRPWFSRQARVYLKVTKPCPRGIHQAAFVP